MTITHGFELLREQQVLEIDGVARLYHHVKTGAQLLSVINDDENKSFGITFRTPVDNSTGVAHILEHSVLCGSRKYPLKDPFIELAKGSMNTFLNAFTYPDKTIYPVASQNLKDFYNLVDFYLDTVFYPRLTRQTFEEQGWHYEIESPEAEMIYKGVVFNEMKGSYASPDRVLSKRAQASIFPDTIYSADSGGDPRHIPDLTYEQLTAFHRTYYHPSNSLICMYGDDDPDVRLRILDACLGEFDRLDVNANVPLQPPFAEPRRLTYSYAAGQQNDGRGDKAMVSVNWMLPEATDPEQMLAFSILEQILVGTPASPLRRALIESGVGEDLTSSGLETDIRQMVFRTGMKGVAADSALEVETLILETLARLTIDGIDADAIEAALNTAEFVLRENNTGSFPRGLALTLRSLSTWIYGGDPIEPLAFEAPLARVCAQARTGRFFEGLIQRYLLDNSHRTTVILTPDPGLDEQLNRDERTRLERERTEMGAEGVLNAVSDTLLLKRLQATPDPPQVLASLPCLSRHDLDQAIRKIPIAEIASAPVTTFYHDLFTNGVVYLDLGLNLHRLPQRLLPFVPLFGRALLEMGTDREDFVQLLQRIGRKTGGVRKSSLLASVRGREDCEAWLMLRSKATASRAGDLLSILRDILLTARFDDRERFRQMAQEEKARLESRIPTNGSGVISQRLRAYFTEADWASEQMGGVSYLFFMRELVRRIETDWQDVLANLEEIRRLLVNRNTMLCNVTLDCPTWQRLQPELNGFLSDLPAASFQPAVWHGVPDVKQEGITIPGQINYVGKAANLYDLGYSEHGSALVALNHLNTTWLWEKVRKEGGAYGVGCSLDRHSGTIGFTSYRDPNVLKTLDNFDGSGHFLRTLDLNEDAVTRTIVGVVGDLDSYQLPDAKGYTSLYRHLTGTTDTIRQRLRDEVLSTTLDDIRNFGAALEQVANAGIVGVVGPVTAIEAANAQRPGLFEIVTVL